MAKSPWSCVLWDVDGTIADASAGIVPRIAQVLAGFGKEPIPAEQVNRWIGPPLLESFEQLGGLTPEQALEAVATYRELAGKAGYATSVRIYDDVPDVIQAVADAGIPQSTASTKPENQVEAILAHYDLAPLFVSIHGAVSDVEVLDTKSNVLGRALRDLGEKGVDISKPVLIGDRHHDIDGAADFDVPVIFVRWGFGREDESAGAAHVVDTPEQLRQLLLPD
ncbi:HAD hydrolase-like protein [Microbacterium amylolyticum]|uniref:Phosphoglycolate phosphatase n=1 Tax=Microbacterium amylolyticum TaxID=936337 RepID=A0ABS4ZHX9_9MICO|nr:HAD hydrolase-like protein [Microbacterium amylolyticum]MBP2436881.1 phosphoglycolate phosphatase [Microbacterium amylolyticum]